jgi:hypothetical protein
VNLPSTVNHLSTMDYPPRLIVYQVPSWKVYATLMKARAAVCAPLSPHRLIVLVALICDSLALLVPLVVFKGVNLQFLFRTCGNELSVLLFRPWVIYSVTMVIRNHDLDGSPLLTPFQGRRLWSRDVVPIRSTEESRWLAIPSVVLWLYSMVYGYLTVQGRK